jgi:hypothetical protein
MRPAVAQDACISCHADAAFLAAVAGDSGRAVELAVDRTQYGESVHGRMGFACTLCHTSVGDYPHGTITGVNCGGCHSKAQVQLAASVHGRPNSATGEVPATCSDCHTTHHIVEPTSRASSVYHQTQFLVCAQCHSDAEKMRRFGQEDAETVGSFINSVHGRGLIAKGLSVAPSCTDCHGKDGSGAHEIDIVSSPTAPTNRLHVAETCGRCHVGISDQYAEGIHGEQFHAGNLDMPTCIDCHAEHAVQPITSPASHVYPTHVAQTCSGCHDRFDLNEKYGIPASRRSSFLGSFHGIALESGQLTVAHCESCHGAHGILPSSDPRSTIFPANLPTTCGKCHPGIGQGVTEGKIHVTSIGEDINLLALGVQWFYYLLIGGIVVYSAVMISVDQYWHRVVAPRRQEGHPRA